MPNYITMPSSRPDGIPPMEDNAGAYYYKYSYSWTSKSASIGENTATNIFLLGASFPPDPATTNPGSRDAFLKHVYLQNGLLYPNTNYTATSTAWVPSENNSVTYYGLLCSPEYISYNRFGTTDEEISIDYT